MRALETFHHTFSEAGTHTFDLGKKPREVLLKNMTSGTIKFSFGDVIDTENDSYSQLPKGMFESINHIVWDDSANMHATIQAEESGDVEIRILDY